MTDLIACVALKADGSGVAGRVRPAVDAVRQLSAEAKRDGAAVAGAVIVSINGMGRTEGLCIAR